MAYTSLELAKVAAISADAKKAFDIEVLDLTGISDVCDYFVILSASNSRQADMLVDEIEEKVFKNCSVKPFSIEGRAGLSWVTWTTVRLWCMCFCPNRANSTASSVFGARLRAWSSPSRAQTGRRRSRRLPCRLARYLRTIP